MFEGAPARRYHAPMSAMADFDVRLPVFAGPFKLLADLILEQKVDVCDVPVARITDAFVTRGSHEVEAWTLDEATWFLAICAVLLELKVDRLLPRPATQTEEDLIGGISPDLVYARSLELAAFQRLSQVFASMMAEAALMVPRSAGPPEEFAHLYPDVMEKVTPELLRHLASEALAPGPSIDLGHVTPIRVTLADALTAVRERLSVTGRASFRELLEDCDERIQVVVRFLALLELYREGQINLSQAKMFGEIRVSLRPGKAGPAHPEGEVPHQDVPAEVGHTLDLPRDDRPRVHLQGEIP
jgi:segregation and condensation protein A